MTALGCADSHVYPCGVELFRQDSEPGYIYFIDTGVTKLTRYEENGAEFILDLRLPGSLLGSEAAIRQKPHPFSAITATACRLTPITARRFLDLLTAEPQLASFIQNNLCAEVLTQAARMSEMACLPARQRLEQLLWALAGEGGDRQLEDIKFQLPIKQWEVAQLLAITPTYLCRLLAELEDEEIINRRNGWIILRKPASLWHRLDS